MVQSNQGSLLADGCATSYSKTAGKQHFCSDCRVKSTDIPKAVIWSLCGFCILLVSARLAIHLKFSRRLWIDDAFTVLALFILIANTIVTTLMAPPLYEILLLSAGLLIPDAGFMDRATFYLKCQFASTVLFWSCLWAVKGCFLAFFWRLTNQLTWPRRAWWVVAVITVLSYIGSVITYPVSCTSFVLGQLALLLLQKPLD